MLKKVGLGILFIVTSPLWILLLLLIAVGGIFASIFHFFCSVIHFFQGKKKYGILPIDEEARRILEKRKNPIQEESSISEEKPSLDFSKQDETYITSHEETMDSSIEEGEEHEHTDSTI